MPLSWLVRLAFGFCEGIKGQNLCRGGRCKALYSVSAARFRSLLKEGRWCRAASGCGTGGGHGS